MSNTNILAVSIHNQEKKAVADLEEGGGPLFFYQTEAQRAKKIFGAHNSIPVTFLVVTVFEFQSNEVSQLMI